ncbi:hypothetical protein [Streptomyces noursei]|uniref:Uncharacterized protein n=1 Tax=Streptomyces noursei TaxID=1971 RepID=A0A2N8PGN2_STRNR|nr:hypothetical protein [Streptomyces noursei]PNE40197.1 hypothetical protein AOB60_04175 [Streptomyces noursei]
MTNRWFAPPKLPSHQRGLFRHESAQNRPVQASVSLPLSGQVTYDLKQDLGNSLVINVPSHQYGWVALSELATKVTGEWTFDVSGRTHLLLPGLRLLWQAAAPGLTNR